MKLNLWKQCTIFECCSTLKFVLRHKWLFLSVSLGWISRTQFEETWATLLGVLVTQPIVMDQEENQQEVMSFTEFFKLNFN